MTLAPRPRSPYRFKTIALAVALSVGSTTPALSSPELDTLRQELDQQRALLQAQQRMIERLEQRLAAQEAAQPAPGAPAGAPTKTAPARHASADGLTFYGLLDTGVEHVTNVGSDHSSVTRMPKFTGSLPSRLGLRAEKTLRDGLKAIGTVEAGFNIDDGTSGQGGRLFGRQIFAGIETPWGKLTFGRQYSMLVVGLAAFDLIGPNIYSTASFDPYLPNARADNTVAWSTRIGGFSTGLTYSFGRDTQGSTPASGTCAGEVPGAYQTCKAWAGMLRYDNQAYSLAAAIETQHGGTGAKASFFNGTPGLSFADSHDTDRRITLGGSLHVGDVKLAAGWLGRRVRNDTTEVTSSIWWLQGAYAFNDALSIDGGLHAIRNSDQDRHAWLALARGFYAIDPSLTAYVQLARLNNSDKAAYTLSGGGAGTAPEAGGGQTGTMVGLRYRF